MHEKSQVPNSEILDEEGKIPCADCHERIFQGSFEDQFESGKGELLFDQPHWDQQMTRIYGDYHGFYDPMVDYMEKPRYDNLITENFAGGHDLVVEYVEKLYSNNGWLCPYSKY